MRALWHLIFAIAAFVMFHGLAFADSRPQEPLYLIYDNNHWGLIDPSGKVVLEPRFERVAKYPQSLGFSELPASEITRAEPVIDSVIPIRLDGKVGFATRDGKVLALGRYEDTGWRFFEGRIIVKSGGRYGYADEHGNLVILARYDEAYPFRDGFAFVKIDKRWGIIDHTGKSVVSPTWDYIDSVSAGLTANEWIGVGVGNRSGVIDRSGKKILPIRFDGVVSPTKPLISAVDSGRVVYVRPGGEVAFELKCPKRLFRKSNERGGHYMGEKVAVVSCGNLGEGREGLIDTQGKFLLDPTWDIIFSFDQGRSQVSKGGRQGIIDDEGRFVLELGKFQLCGIQEGMVCFVDPGSSKLGFLDLNGRVVIPASYDSVLGFQEGLAVARTDERRPYGNGYIDRKGSWVIGPSYWRANPFKGLLATVEQPVAMDTLEVTYIEKSGKSVYRMRFKGYISVL